MIRVPGYREVREGVSVSDHWEMAKRGCLYSARSEHSVTGLIKALQFSLFPDNSLSAVSLHLSISFQECGLLSFFLSAHAHTRTHPTAYLYFLPAIMLLVSTHSIHGTQNVSGGHWTTGDWSNLKICSLISEFFHILSCGAVDGTVKKRP